MRRLFPLAAAVFFLPATGLLLHAQQTLPAEPGTESTQVSPASKAPNPVQKPDVRLDSTPHTDLDESLDSAPYDQGLGVNVPLAMGPPLFPPTPAGMIARSASGDPRMVYFALRHRSGDDLTPTDRSVLDAREADLARAAAYHGYYLKQPGWMYQQGLCPATQPDAEQVTGVPAAADGEGFLLLHFVQTEDGRVSAFTAIVPRVAGLPVRVIAVAHRNVERRGDFLSEKTSGQAVNEAIPPAALYQNMQPQMDWIAATACIAEIGGAYPHIPNEPYLSDAIMIAPPPLIRLLVDGQRRITFTDRIDDTHYVIWDEHISRHGRMLDAQHEEVSVKPRPLTNPPLPPIHALAAPAQPSVHIKPPPPSPFSGARQ